MLVAAVVTKFSDIRGLVQKDPERLGQEWNLCKQYLRDGVYVRRKHGSVGWHKNPAAAESMFETVQGPKVEKIFAAEGFLGDWSDRLAGLKGEETERCVQVSRLFSETAGAMKSANHVLIVVRKVQGND